MFDTGYPNGVFIQPLGAGAFTQIDIYGHNHSEQDQGHEVSSTLHNGVQAFADSLLRGEATVRGHLKRGAYPWTQAIKARGRGYLKVQYGNVQPFVIPYRIPRVGYTNETAAGTDFEATFTLDAETPSVDTGSPPVTQYTYPS